MQHAYAAFSIGKSKACREENNRKRIFRLDNEKKEGEEFDRHEP